MRDGSENSRRYGIRRMIQPENAREFLLRAELELKERLRNELAKVGALSAERLFLFGAAKRTLAQGHGFRIMEDEKNATVAAALVRLQLDTLLRLYALWWVADSGIFASAVLDGKQINRMKADDGEQMTDGYLYKRLAEEVPWIRTVYGESSGFIHFSQRHMLLTLDTPESSEPGSVTIGVGALDTDRPSTFFRQLASSFTDITMRIGLVLNERFDILTANHSDEALGFQGPGED